MPHCWLIFYEHLKHSPAELAPHDRLKEVARKEGVSTNLLIILTISKKLSALMTVDYLQERAAKGDRQAIENIPAKVPDTEPDERVRL